MLVGNVRRGNGFEPVLKVKVPVASKEAPGLMSSSMVVLVLLENGGFWGKVIPTPLKMGEQKL